MTTAWSQHGLTLAWREDDFGHSGRSLYLGTILVGYVTEGRDNSGVAEFLAWVCSQKNNYRYGPFATEQEARGALVVIVLEAMRDE